MKKFILMTALAAGFLTSCSEDDFGTQSVVDSNTIAFATKQSAPLTRSGETITSINKFTVSAVNEDNSSFFANEEFTYNAGSGVFQSQTPHYWPTTGTLSFYAISEIGSHAVDANNIPTYTYTNWAAEKDLVAATVKAGEKDIPYPLNFRHLTSQIVVSAEAENKTEELTYKLVSVKMTAPSTGTYSFANTTGGVGTWAIDNSKTSEYSYNEALPMSFKQNGQIELSSTYWNILPVTDGDLIFQIEYQVLQNGKVICDNTGSNYKECIVENAGLVSGRMYRYNFILPCNTNDQITFTSTMGNWEDGNSSNQSANDTNEDVLNYNYNVSTKTASVAKYTGNDYYSGDIIIPGTVAKDGVNYQVTSIEDYAFKYCTDVTSVVIPEGVTNIGREAFADYSGKSLLSSINIPNSVLTIGENALADGKSLPVVNNLRYADTYLVSAVDRDLSTYEIKEGTRFLGTNAFCDCRNMTSISIPNTVICVGINTFCNCTGLTSITIPSSVTKIENYAFWQCHNLSTVIVEATVPPTLGTSAISNITIKVPTASLDAYKTADGWSQHADKIEAM